MVITRRGWFVPLVVGACLVGCKAGHRGGPGASPPSPLGNEAYVAVVENEFVATTAQPLSTFGLDVDSASYANVRDLLQRGQLPPPEAVRVEEFVNAFRCRTPAAAVADGVPFAVATEVQPCPWQEGNLLLRVAVQARADAATLEAPARLVFLIDVSGSMGEPDKLPLLQRAFDVLIDSLRPHDQVAIVTYGTDVEVPLRSATGADKERLRAVVAGLTAEGGTNGAAGLRAACQIAKEMGGEGQRRVVLVTDGDFNVGESTTTGLLQLLAREKRADTFLTVVGCGRGNLKQTNLAAVATAGDGSCHYLDGMPAAKRLFGSRFHAEALCVARDVRLQIEFNPERVGSWRQLGYEDRTMAARDFADAQKDGGEVGSGQTAVALYELVPKGGTVHDGVSLRYAPASAPTSSPTPHADEFAMVKLGWVPLGRDATLRQVEVAVPCARLSVPASPDFAVASTAAAFALQMRASRHRGRLDWPMLVRMTDRLAHDEVEQHELTTLVATAERLTRGRS